MVRQKRQEILLTMGKGTGLIASLQVNFGHVYISCKNPAPLLPAATSLKTSAEPAILGQRRAPRTGTTAGARVCHRRALATGASSKTWRFSSSGLCQGALERSDQATERDPSASARERGAAGGRGRAQGWGLLSADPSVSPEPLGSPQAGFSLTIIKYIWATVVHN